MVLQASKVRKSRACLVGTCPSYIRTGDESRNSIAKPRKWKSSKAGHRLPATHELTVPWTRSNGPVPVEVAIQNTRGQREAELSDSWDRNSSGGRSARGAGPAGKNEHESCESWIVGVRDQREGSIRQEMRHLSFRGQRPEEDWAWPQGNFQAGDVFGERQQGHHGVAEGLDRKRGFADAALQRRAGARASQGRGCVRQNSLKPSQKKRPREPDCSSRRGPKFK